MTNKTEQQTASHFAVRADVYGALVKILGTLPWEQVHQIMQELMRSQPMSGAPADPAAVGGVTIPDRNNTPPQ